MMRSTVVLDKIMPYFRCKSYQAPIFNDCVYNLFSSYKGFQEL